MGRRNAHTPPADSARVSWLGRAQRQVHSDLDKAREDHSWSAVAALHRQLQQLRGEYDLARAELRAEQQQVEDENPIELSAEEWRDRIETDAAEASVADLEIYVREWLQRMNLTIDDSTNPPTLRRKGLRLVAGDE